MFTFIVYEPHIDCCLIYVVVALHCTRLRVTRTHLRFTLLLNVAFTLRYCYVVAFVRFTFSYVTVVYVGWTTLRVAFRRYVVTGVTLR